MYVITQLFLMAMVAIVFCADQRQPAIVYQRKICDKFLGSYSNEFAMLKKKNMGYVITGNGFSVLSIDSLGDTLWFNRYPNKSTYVPRSIKESPNGTIFVIGTDYNSTDKQINFIEIFDKDGSCLQSKIYKQTDTLGSLVDIIITDSDTLLLAKPSSTASFMDRNKFQLYSLNSDLSLKLKKTLVFGSYVNLSFGIIKAPGGGFYIYSDIKPGIEDSLVIIRLNSDCDSIWRKSTRCYQTFGTGTINQLLLNKINQFVHVVDSGVIRYDAGLNYMIDKIPWSKFKNMRCEWISENVSGGVTLVARNPSYSDSTYVFECNDQYLPKYQYAFTGNPIQCFSNADSSIDVFSHSINNKPTLTKIFLRHPPELVEDSLTLSKSINNDMVYVDTLRVTDKDSGDHFIYYCSKKNKPLVLLDSFSGIITVKPNIYDTGLIPINVYVKDSYGLIDSTSFTVNIKFTNWPPTIIRPYNYSTVWDTSKIIWNMYSNPNFTDSIRYHLQFFSGYNITSTSSPIIDLEISNDTITILSAIDTSKLFINHNYYTFRMRAIADNYTSFYCTPVTFGYSSSGTESERLKELQFEDGLHELRPNPFNPTTTISFSIKKENRVNLKVLDINGHVVDELTNKVFQPGNYQIKWNPSKDFPTGIYFINLRIGAKSYLQKGLLIR